MTDLRTAAQQALEALGEIEWSNNSQWQSDRAKVAITALKAALEEPVDQPAAWIYEFWADPGHKGLSWNPESSATNIPLWTHPPQTKTNQCGETCERAKLCATCLSPL